MLVSTASVVLILGYGSAALLLSIGALGFALVVRGSLSDAARAPERWLACGWLLIVLSLTLPWVWQATVRHDPGAAAVEIWGGPQVDADGAPSARMTLRWSGLSDVEGDVGLALDLDLLAMPLGLLLGGVLVSLGALALRRRRLARACRELPVIRRIGRVTVCVSEATRSPFAARVAGRAFIVVPAALVGDRPRLCLVVAHEAHHHRRGDLRAAALLALLRALFFWNPLLALWQRALMELEDLACDRRVLGRPRVSSVDYARALVWAAEAAIEGRTPLGSGARGMASQSFHCLKRRILVLDQMHREPRHTRVWIVGLAASAVLLTTSWMVQAAVADHRVAARDVATMAARIEKRAGFPVLADEGVVSRLNEWVAVAEEREALKRALERMPAYRSMIEDTLRARGLPVELLSMALAESRFDNEAHPGTPVERRSAGIWQIIPSTARKLGLEVTPARDERLDPRRATEAAAVFLNELFGRYRDWPVAIAAYNAGPRHVDALIAGTASAVDARERVLAGDAEHARYVRAVMAALIVIENPTLLD